MNAHATTSTTRVKASASVENGVGRGMQERDKVVSNVNVVYSGRALSYLANSQVRHSNMETNTAN